MFKYKEVITLLVVLTMALFINPQTVYQVYNNTLGKLFLLVIIGFLAMKNVTLGLLLTLILIIILKQNNILTEGMDKLTPSVKKEDNKQFIKASGIDISSIEDSIRSKQSQSIPVDKAVSSSSENVNPFTSGMLTNETTLTEGFCPCATCVI